MILVLRTLLSPLKYLKARNPQKEVWDWFLPLIIAAFAVLAVFLMPKPVVVLGDKGLVYWVNELLKILVGFYIAALAAIASFDRPSLDQVIEGDGVTLDDRGDMPPRQLTRRQFLSLMFGYLSLLALFLYCTGLGVSLLSENIKLLPVDWLRWLRLIFVFGYSLLFGQLLTVTLMTMYYLSDRVHRQTPTPLPPEDVPHS